MTDFTELAGNLIIKEGKLLVLYRKDEKQWELPGGKVKEEEQPTQAAVREAKEEIGVNVDLEKPFFSGEFQKDEKLYLWHGYLAKTSDEPELREEKFSKYQWITSEELDKFELAPNLEQIKPGLRNILK